MEHVDLNADDEKLGTFYEILRGGIFLSQNLLNLTPLPSLQMTSQFILQEPNKYTLSDNIAIDGIPRTPMAPYLNRQFNYLRKLVKTEIRGCIPNCQ